MAGNDGLFRTTKFGGYDRDEVEEGIQKIKDEAQAEITRLTNALKDRDLELSKTKSRLEEKSETVEKLEKDIKDKYQSYIDNYDNIGKLVFDAQLRADKIVKDAKNERANILDTAKTEAEKYVVSAQFEVDKKVDEGKRKYIAIQEELSTMVALMNKVQRQFMESVKSVHSTMNSLPANVAEALDDQEDHDEIRKEEFKRDDSDDRNGKKGKNKNNNKNNTENESGKSDEDMSSTQKLNSLAEKISHLGEEIEKESDTNEN